MTKIVFLIAIVFVFLSTSAEAKHRHSYRHHYHHKVAATSYAVHPDCNILWPCAGVETSVRGQRVVKAMGGFGSANQRYTPAKVQEDQHSSRRPLIDRAEPLTHAIVHRTAQIVAHPSGCPARAFCGCGLAVHIFGSPVRSLWLAAEWPRRFHRANPAPGMVAARSHHVMGLEYHISGNIWMVYDANSGRGRTQIHPRSIAGYTIVNPHG